MTLMTIGACVILGRLGDVPHLLRPLGWLLADIGAAGLWGSALTRMEDPSNPRSKTSGRSYAAIAGAAYIATTIPEISSIVESLQFRRAFNDQSVLVNLILIPARFCLLWCAIQPFRSYADDGAIRRSALATHHIMIVWFLLSLLGGGWMLLAFSPMGSGSRGGGWGETAGLWRLATHYTLLATAVVAVGLSQETPDRSTTSTHPVFPDL
jgi:hypothetical protein